MALNPNLCVHKWRYATSISSTGTFAPNYKIILFCEKCAKVKEKKLK